MPLRGLDLITCLGLKYGSDESVKFSEDISREMAVAGWEAEARGPEEFRALLVSEVNRYTDIARAANIRSE